MLTLYIYVISSNSNNVVSETGIHCNREVELCHIGCGLGGWGVSRPSLCRPAAAKTSLSDTSFQLCFLAGDQCGCSRYSMLLYALFSAVTVLLLALIGLVLIYKVSEFISYHVLS